jgi:hypothetical protein
MNLVGGDNFLSLERGTTFIIRNDSGTDSAYVKLPTIENIRKFCDVKVGESYAIEIKVVARYYTPRSFNLSYDNGQYLLYQWNGGTQVFNLQNGDSFVILLLSDGSSFWAQILNQKA